MAITPLICSVEESDASLKKAPLSLNEAVCCLFSNLRNTSEFVFSDSSVELRKGVTLLTPFSFTRAD